MLKGRSSVSTPHTSPRSSFSSVSYPLEETLSVIGQAIRRTFSGSSTSSEKAHTHSSRPSGFHTHHTSNDSINVGSLHALSRTSTEPGSMSLPERPIICRDFAYETFRPLPSTSNIYRPLPPIGIVHTSISRNTNNTPHSPAATSPSKSPQGTSYSILGRTPTEPNLEDSPDGRERRSRYLGMRASELDDYYGGSQPVESQSQLRSSQLALPSRALFTDIAHVFPLSQGTHSSSQPPSLVPTSQQSTDESQLDAPFTPSPSQSPGRAVRVKESSPMRGMVELPDPTEEEEEQQRSPGRYNFRKRAPASVPRTADQRDRASRKRLRAH